MLASGPKCRTCPRSIKVEPARTVPPVVGRGLLIAALGLGSALPASAQTTEFDVVAYHLSLSMDLERRGVWAPLNTLSATAGITFINTLASPISQVPLVLHRLLKVEAVRTDGGRSLDFRQQLAGIEDWENYQANTVTVALDQPLLPGDTLTMEIDYAGGLDGYQESGMLYVQESLNPDFTMIRPETSSYPHLAHPTRRSLRGRFGGDPFDQVLEITVPEGLVVASGLELVERRMQDGAVTWVFRSEAPGSQILFAVAPYEVIEVGQARIFHFPEDEEGARRVADGLADAMALYERWFGVLRDELSFAVVEIPEWHGSQALRPTVIQEVTAFRDASAITELYHEVSHFWNVEDPSDNPSRWNEGLATYLQQVTRQELQGEEGLLDREMERYREALRTQLDENPDYRGVPLMQAGERDLTSVLSYRGGGLMFALLHHRLGRERLFSVLRDFYQRFRDSGATSLDFADFVMTEAPETRPIMDEWFVGSAYSTLLLDGLNFEALIRRYSAG